jgi:hypothetical protein
MYVENFGDCSLARSVLSICPVVLTFHRTIVSRLQYAASLRIAKTLNC